MEFGRTGMYWSDQGWKLDVQYRKLDTPVRTMDNIDSLRSLLPSTKSPIQPSNGRGNQADSFEIEKPLALALVSGNHIVDSTETADTIDIHIEKRENRIEEDIQ
jgi:hypothetical protein